MLNDVECILYYFLIYCEQILMHYVYSDQINVFKFNGVSVVDGICFNYFVLLNNDQL